MEEAHQKCLHFRTTCTQRNCDVKHDSAFEKMDHSVTCRGANAARDSHQDWLPEQWKNEKLQNETLSAHWPEFLHHSGVCPLCPKNGEGHFTEEKLLFFHLQESHDLSSIADLEAIWQPPVVDVATTSSVEVMSQAQDEVGHLIEDI